MQRIKAICFGLTLSLASLGLFACSSSKPIAAEHSARSYVQLTTEAGFFLPNWSEVQDGRVKSYMQDLEILSEKGSGHLRVMLELSDQRFGFLAFDQFGRRALELRWDDTGLHSQRADWLPMALRGEDVLGYVFLAFGSERTVRKHVEVQGLSLVADELSREISTNGKPIIRIDYGAPMEKNWLGSVEIHNLAYGFKLRIQSVEVPS